MLFNSAAFAVFLPAMLGVYWALRGSARRGALLLGSYFFYAWWDWRFTGLLLLSTIVDYCCGRAMERQPAPSVRKRWLCLSIVTNLGVLATFKYFNFFRDSFAALLTGVGLHFDLPALNVLLPMGISFYTFQTMSYTIDIYRGAKAERSLLSFAIFVACFPQLVAGPIMRAGVFLPQLKTDRRFERVDVSAGVYRIFRGLFKKMVIADTLALYVDAVFAEPAGYTGLSAWIALYAYAFQIYMDFSGYTDVAIGVGRLLGLKLTENFDRPYLAASPSEFWRRWHITLSTWLRDYLYIPLGGSRFGRLCTLRNLFITMALGGLWHGAAWTFVAWGVYHACLLTGERLLLRDRARVPPETQALPYRLLSVLAMFHLSCLGWLLFRAPDWGTVQTMFVNLFDFSAGDVRGLRCALIVLACALAHVLPAMNTLVERFARLPALGQGAFAAMCMWALLLLGPGAKPFIYFRF
jgi:alginate O-acetyltransferase complex protein AlgI